MIRESTQILRHAFGDNLEESTLEALRQAGDLRHYPEGTVLLRQGEQGRTFYVIVAGLVAVTKHFEDGTERLLSVLEAGQYFGEMALIDDSPRMATCVAKTPVTLLEFSEEVFMCLLVESPAVANALLHRVLSDMRVQDRLAITDLRQKNDELERAYAELQAAQAELVLKERLEHELQLAAAVQRDLLPGALPHFPPYCFAAYLQPARLVGGDFYDVIALEDEHVGILMADVADKGLHAALMMAVTRTLFRHEAQHSLSPADVALAVHRGMLDIAQTNESFLTAFYGVLHRPSGNLTYVRAAQERPLLARPGGSVLPLPGEGRFLGMLPELSLQEYSFRLQPGDRLLLFSDGVTDAVNARGEYYGYERLQEKLRYGVRLPAAELAQAIVDDVDRWSAGVEAFDDLTLLALEVRD